jgi:hypothetical protein
LARLEEAPDGDAPDVQVERSMLHGHVHESARLTGEWRDQLGRTHCLSAAHDGGELALVRFDLESPGQATRALIPPPDLPAPAGAPRR